MSLSNITINALNGQPLDLKKFAGKPILFVNVASACGLTPQYAALQKLYEQYQSQGLEVIAVPCNQFGAQEPGSPAEIQSFCDTKYNVSFTLTEKVDVNGSHRHPLYVQLIADGDDIEWNFAKFLVDKNGNTVARFHPKIDPLDTDVIRAIEAAL